MRRDESSTAGWHLASRPDLEVEGRGAYRNQPRSWLLRRMLTLLPLRLGPNCYHCFQSSSNDHSVRARGQGPYYLSKAKSQSPCPVLSAFPTLGCVLKRKTLSILPLSQALSLLSGLETPDRKECSLSLLSTSIHALLWGPCFAAAETSKLFLQSQHPG